jgi:hypothetical protein
MHNDLQLQNLFVKENSSKETRTYYFNNMKFTRDTQWVIKIYDYDLGYMDKEKNSVYEPLGTKLDGRRNELNPQRDVWIFIRKIFIEYFGKFSKGDCLLNWDLISGGKKYSGLNKENVDTLITIFRTILNYDITQPKNQQTLLFEKNITNSSFMDYCNNDLINVIGCSVSPGKNIVPPCVTPNIPELDIRFILKNFVNKFHNELGFKNPEIVYAQKYLKYKK